MAFSVHTFNSFFVANSQTIANFSFAIRSQFKPEKRLICSNTNGVAFTAGLIFFRGAIAEENIKYTVANYVVFN